MPTASSRAPGARTARNDAKFTSDPRCTELASACTPSTSSALVTRRPSSALRTSRTRSLSQSQRSKRSKSPPRDRASRALSRLALSCARDCWRQRPMPMLRHSAGRAAAARQARETHAAAHSVVTSPAQNESTRSTSTAGSTGAYRCASVPAAVPPARGLRAALVRPIWVIALYLRVAPRAEAAIKPRSAAQATLVNRALPAGRGQKGACRRWAPPRATRARHDCFDAVVVCIIPRH